MTQMTTRPVLLIRGSGNERDAKALSALDIPTVSESFIQITPGEKDVALQLFNLASEIDGWVIVTSRNGLNYWKTLIDLNSLADVFSNNPKLKFAAIGTGTAEALRSVGVPEVFRLLVLRRIRTRQQTEPHQQRLDSKSGQHRQRVLGWQAIAQ